VLASSPDKAQAALDPYPRVRRVPALDSGDNAARLTGLLEPEDRFDQVGVIQLAGTAERDGQVGGAD
jgi:hypothetical protein